MKKLAYPLILVFFSLLFATIFTTVTAMTLASYVPKADKVDNMMVKQQLAIEGSTVSR